MQGRTGRHPLPRSVDYGWLNGRQKQRRPAIPSEKAKGRRLLIHVVESKQIDKHANEEQTDDRYNA